MKYTFEPIGIIRTCFQDKFGVPRQPGLVPSARGTLILKKDPHFINAVKELESFSHLWLIFVFHDTGSESWKPSIRPPRLGGSRKVGVLASRSPHRPNPIGLSVVKLEKIEIREDQVQIEVSGVDLLDETPILDLKPYLSYADSIPEANPGWADSQIQRFPIHWTPEAEAQCQNLLQEKKHSVKALTEEILSLDPRPAFQKRQYPPGAPESEKQRFGVQIEAYNVLWEIRGQEFWITEFEIYQEDRL